MKSYTIYLIRNGLTDANLEGRYIGHTDVRLSGEGERQLLEMKREYEYPEPDAVFASPLKRCVKTAQLLYPDSDAIVINDLIEYDFGEFEGLTADELSNHPVFPSWLAGEPDAEPPFGESNADFQRRVCVCFCRIVEGLMKTGTTKAAIVTHGGVIMTILAAFGIPEAPMHEWLTPNGCGYSVRVTPSIWTRGQKFEVYEELPLVPGSFSEPDIFDGFNVEDFLYD
ncbi:MAG: histidine phosphatase family protein [Oscillospiraceae bacterium]|nr:histidine phosphatase family protein [Oscillospiraceae bacterium]